MLLQFTVENFRSIKERAYLSLIPAVADKTHLDNIAQCGNAEALKAIALYGANASGKSNLFKAMTAALVAIRGSNSRQVSDTMDFIVPFQFDEAWSKRPTSFEFTFIASDGLKYIYGFSADRYCVYEEYLYCYHSLKPSKIFERDVTGKIDCTLKEKPVLDPLSERNTKNKLFLSTATMWNYEKTYYPYIWLEKLIDTYSDFQPMIGAALQKYTKENDSDLKEFTMKLLRQADINIDDYYVDVEKANTSEIADPLLAAIMQSSFPGFENRSHQIIHIKTGHTINGSDKKAQYFLNIQEESQGTQQLFMLSPILKDVFENGKTMIIDELDRSLHSFLVQFLVNLFLSPSTNKNNAQLIFSTHDTNLLSLNMFRRDQIYFVEKSAETAETDLYSLDDFSVRKSENIERGYLLGRYGAIPFLHTEEKLWE